MADITVKIDGVDRAIDVESTDTQEIEAYIGTDLVVTEWQAYHWSEDRMLTEAEYDSISEADNERICDMLTKAVNEDRYQGDGL